MSITNYTTLQTELVGWLNDAITTTAAQTFIQLAEREFIRDERVRDFANDGAVITPLSGAVATNWLLTGHPDIYLYGALVEAAPYLVDDTRVEVWDAQLAKRLAKLNSSRLDMTRTPSLADYAGLQGMISEYLDRPDLTPLTATFITLAEAAFKRDLAGAEAITALSAGDNWLFTSHPDVYLYGALCEAAPWLGDDPRLATWKALRDERIAEVLRTRTDTAYTLTTYAGLQTAVKGWLDRADVDAVALIDLAEKSLARDDRLKKLKSAAFSITEDDIAVPTDFHFLQSWYHDGPTYFGPIAIVGADSLSTNNALYGTTGAPAQAAILDSKFRFSPAPDTTYATKMVYWRTLGSVADDTSWLFTAAPDIYLYAALVEGAIYLKEDPSVWVAKRDAEIERLNRETWHTHASGTMRRQARPIGG